MFFPLNLIIFPIIDRNTSTLKSIYAYNAKQIMHFLKVETYTAIR